MLVGSTESLTTAPCPRSHINNPNNFPRESLKELSAGLGELAKILEAHTLNDRERELSARLPGSKEYILGSIEVARVTCDVRSSNDSRHS